MNAIQAPQQPPGVVNPVFMNNTSGTTATTNTPTAPTNNANYNNPTINGTNINNNNKPTNNINTTTTTTRALDDPNVYHWICQLAYGPQKEQALLELGRKREQYDDLAIVLWCSFGVITSLIQEIISVYPLLHPPTLTHQLSNRVCNALVLLQCLASHRETKFKFIQAQLPFYLFPFLSTTSKNRSFEYLRLTSLGVIGALVKNDSPEVIQFLLRTEIIPLCLRIMETSTELSKTVAIFILQKILMDDNGLQYICVTQERFMAVSTVLTHMIDQLSEQVGGTATTGNINTLQINNNNINSNSNTNTNTNNPTTNMSPGRLLKHIVRCYLRLSDNIEARQVLKHVLPRQLMDDTFNESLKEDVNTKRCLAQLLLTLNEEN
ncbi:CCR4-NOT core subunit CAF40 SCDLUD_005084 [Saccharomycodes ludwigii]|uniref:CCR4-NOT core subunit CAF40 n=1 Tax=Saccharomycodes ludwigii TaxID=36035 RepID=UPI001E82B94E|nr:hypothetical protein SCDLUD_005084 [Saccharomycodes ludwigii]KAH3898752.1 hypothetical protein SCDLUD_005084 [Saccharomycodes ludwigii]